MKKKNKKPSINWKENPPPKPARPDPKAHKEPCAVCEATGHCNHCAHQR